MEIKLTVELEKPKDTDYDLVLAETEKNHRPTIEQLKEASSKIAYPLVSTHSDWVIELEESDWDCDFCGGSWHCDVSLHLEISEIGSGDIVDEFLAWELLGEPLDKEVFEPLHSCDWSSLENKKEINLQFSSLKAAYNSNGDGIFFYYNHS
jgi:hypothetical protein